MKGLLKEWRFFVVFGHAVWASRSADHYAMAFLIVWTAIWVEHSIRMQMGKVCLSEKKP